MNPTVRSREINASSGSVCPVLDGRYICLPCFHSITRKTFVKHESIRSWCTPSKSSLLHNSSGQCFISVAGSGLSDIHCMWNEPPVPDTLYGLNSHPPQHPLYHFLVSPPSLASNAEPHVSPQPEMPFLPTFFMTGSSSFKSQLRCHPLREGSQSPLAKVAFLSHSLTHYSIYAFLSTLIEAVFVPWLFVCPPMPCRFHDSRDPPPHLSYLSCYSPSTGGTQGDYST